MEPPKLFNEIVSIPVFIFIVFIFILSIVTHYIQTNTSSQSTFNNYLYFFTFLFIIIIGFFVSTRFSQNKTNIYLLYSSLFFISILLFTLLSIHFYYFFQVISKSYMMYLLLFFIFITGFTIFYNVLKKISIFTSTNSNILLQIIFFIPCLVTDFIQYLFQDYQTTPNIVFILFIIEILFVLLYLYIPKWIMISFKMNRISILDNSVFLDKQVIIRNSDSFLIEKPQTSKFFFASTDNTIINKNYAITFWVYISSPEKMTETEIFNYEYHPRLTYYNNTNNKLREQDKYIIYFTKETSYKFSAPQQKWNFFVINYNDNGICDLFLNGELIKSVDIGKNLPIYNISDNISIGQDGGNYGSISNISYYKNPLTISQITTTYNLLMFKNPPTF